MTKESMNRKRASNTEIKEMLLPEKGIMPRCACAREAYGSRFFAVCVSVCLSVCYRHSCSASEIQVLVYASMCIKSFSWI